MLAPDAHWIDCFGHSVLVCNTRALALRYNTKRTPNNVAHESTILVTHTKKKEQCYVLIFFTSSRVTLRCQRIPYLLDLLVNDQEEDRGVAGFGGPAKRRDITRTAAS